MANFFQRLFGSSPEPTEIPAEPQKSADALLSDANRLMLLLEVKRQAEARGDKETAKACLDMTYNGPLPELRADGSYSCVYELQDYNIAGINYRDNITAYLGDFEGYLKPDQDNEHDPNAIAVHARDGHHLGFIPAACTEYIRSLGKPFPIAITGTIEQEHDDVEDCYYFVGTVFMYVLRQ